MLSKFVREYRPILFAFLMSCSTALLVSGIVIYLQPASTTRFIARWFSAFILAWPIVFVAILVLAPLINQMLDRWLHHDN